MCLDKVNGADFFYHLSDLGTSRGEKVGGQLEITGGAGAQGLCFSDVEDSVGGIFEKIKARSRRESLYPVANVLEFVILSILHTSILASLLIFLNQIALLENFFSS